MAGEPAPGPAPRERSERLKLGVLALQGDVREHAAALRASGAAAVPVRRPEEIDDLDGIVIPGGESTTMSKLMVDFGVYEPLRKRVNDGMPAYGSCAGMILLATEILDGRPDQVSLGALDVTVRRNAFGRQVDSFEAPVTLDGDDFHAVFIRAPWVERVGDGVEVLGRVNAGPSEGRIVAVRQRNVLATAFHPELTGDRRVHRLFVDMARRAKSTED
ncbi:pyridoxal 5'-phosphate synthase glutaminase subunit PdxT [Virgisporangium ochraceum]|uniref:Pyridoxal 5'-phosphate synthase subunit PdxT n=1 Tax=Virgisporangium ochraceum TaxID=65505 RepID=A0A8J4EH21_9ACTN|nr:pyridoxal 5'-phosphate synthase glutaminase subunit PdxT [Virgisporangium ochraceum]GIJ74263.1 pyridoxal 5'-phosphate synthase subunit PdxT [Virgisporangium ochraceum]